MRWPPVRTNVDEMQQRRPKAQKCCRDYTHGVVDVLVLAHARQREKFGAGDKAAGVEQ